MCCVITFVRLIIKTCFNIIIKTLKQYFYHVKPNGLNTNLKYMFSGDSLENKLRWLEYRCVRMLVNSRNGFMVLVSFLVVCCVISQVSFLDIGTKIMLFLVCMELVYLLLIEGDSVILDLFVVWICLSYYANNLRILLTDFSVFKFSLTLMSIFMPLICVYNHCLHYKKEMKWWLVTVVATAFFVGESLLLMGICQNANFFQAEELMKNYELDELKIAIDKNLEAWSQYNKSYNSDDISSMGTFTGKMILIGYQNFIQEQPMFFDEAMVEKSVDNNLARQKLIAQIERCEQIVREDNTWHLIVLIIIVYKWIFFSIIPIVILAYWKR